MNVGELIRLLQTHPPDLRVVLDGYEDGYEDLSPGQLRLARIRLTTGEREYVGKHGEADFLRDLEVVQALALHRTSN